MDLLFEIVYDFQPKSNRAWKANDRQSRKEWLVTPRVRVSGQEISQLIFKNNCHFIYTLWCRSVKQTRHGKHFELDREFEKLDETNKTYHNWLALGKMVTALSHIFLAWLTCLFFISISAYLYHSVKFLYSMSSALSYTDRALKHYIYHV